MSRCMPTIGTASGGADGGIVTCGTAGQYLVVGPVRLASSCASAKTATGTGIGIGTETAIAIGTMIVTAIMIATARRDGVADCYPVHLPLDRAAD